MTTAPPGANAGAELQPIAGDPEGDQRLALRVPRGEPGEPGPPGPVDDPDVTQIVGLSWVHDAALGRAEFEKLMVDASIADVTTARDIGIGLVILFSKEVQMATIVKQPTAADPSPRSQVFQLYVRLQINEFAVECECLVPQVVCQAVQVNQVDGNGLITDITPLPGKETTKAVRLVLPHTNYVWFMQANPMRLRVELRADFVLDLDGKAVDGNNIGGLTPGRPSGNGRQGDTFESWLTVSDIT